jgi:hypothetical protein
VNFNKGVIVKPKFTEEPWHLSKTGEDLPGPDSISIRGPRNTLIAEVYWKDDQDQGFSNAKIIVMSPRMYNFLANNEASLVRFFEGLEGPFSDCARDVKDIVKQGKGEE